MAALWARKVVATIGGVDVAVVAERQREAVRRDIRHPLPLGKRKVRWGLAGDFGDQATALPKGVVRGFGVECAEVLVIEAVGADRELC